MSKFKTLYITWHKVMGIFAFCKSEEEVLEFINLSNSVDPLKFNDLHLILKDGDKVLPFLEGLLGLNLDLNHLRKNEVDFLEVELKTGKIKKVQITGVDLQKKYVQTNPNEDEK